MGQAVDFAVRDAAGAVVRGEVGDGGGTHLIRTGAGEAIALKLAQAQVSSYARHGGNLVVTLIDGREIVVAGFFEAPAGLENRLYLSANGDIAQVHLTDGGIGALRSSYGVNEGRGNYSALDGLRFESGDVLTTVGNSSGDTTGMAPFLPGLLAGFGGKGLMAAGALTGGVALLGSVGDGGGEGGGGGGGDGGRARPTVDNAGSTSTLTTGTTDPQIAVTGTGVPGDTVSVTLGNVTATTTITSGAIWGVTIPGTGLPADGTYKAAVLVTPPVGTNLPPITLAGPGFVIDMTPPPVSVIEGSQAVGHVENLAAHGNGVRLGGTGEPGTTITVEVAGATQTTTVGANGTWSVTFTATQVVGGEYTVPVTVTATDPVGNRTVITENLVVDTVPNPVAVNPVTPDNVVDRVEQAGGFAVTGTTAAGATVTVAIGTFSQTATADASGRWTVNVAAGTVPQGDYDAKVTARTVDAAGNASTTTQTLRVDTAAAVTQSGPVAMDDIVNAAETAAGVALTGTVQPGSVVSVAWNGTSLPATVTANGAWSVTFPGTALPSGERDTTIIVTATDAVGNTATTARPVRIDTMTAVSAGPGQAGGDDIIAGTEQQAGIALTGRAEAGAVVAVTLEGVTRTVTALADGAWTATFARAEIPQGTYDTTVTIRATDLAGNTATATHALAVDTEVHNFVRTGESTGSDHVLNGAEAVLGLSLVGTVEPGSSLLVRFGTGLTRAALVGNDGTWALTIPASEVPAGDSSVPLTMTATDRLGNVATLTEQVSVDRAVQTFTRTGGAIGADGLLNAADVAQGLPLGGTVEPGATVVVRLSNGVEKTVVAGASGQWNIAFAAADLPGGEQSVSVQLTATDRAGNTATLSETFRVDTTAPGAPEVVGFSRNSSGLRRLATEISDDAYSFASLDASGRETAISARRVDNVADNESEFRFGTNVPDGSYLVVHAADAAGNQSSTLVIVDNTNASTVDLGRPGLAGFDFSAIDLTFAPDAQMTISEAQLQALTGPDRRLIVKGGEDDTVTLTGGATTGQTTEIDGERYAIFTLGHAGAAVLLDDDIRAVI